MMGVASEKGATIWAKPTAAGSSRSMTTAPATRQTSFHKERRTKMAKKHTAASRAASRLSTANRGMVKALDEPGIKKNTTTCL